MVLDTDGGLDLDHQDFPHLMGFIGIAQWRRGKHGRGSPYRGMFYWHHITGLVFGVIALAFVASGLVSMHPWGFLDSRGTSGERGRLDGSAPRWIGMSASVEALQDAMHVPPIAQTGL